MLVPLTWLKEHLTTQSTVEELCDALVQLGHEVEEVTDNAAKYAGVVVGKVLEREQHPDADRLGVCKVDIGTGELQQIVCGAPNARAGITVAVATIGAVLPGNFEIKKSKIRGIESCGMICSIRELAMGDEHDGIWEMDTDAAVGTPLSAVIGSETVIDLAITPNRGDCLSIRGIARELAALGFGTLTELPSAEVGTKQPQIACDTQSKNCMFFSGVEIRGLKVCKSPDWLQQRLESMGLTPRNAIVDITNYMMFDLGQPMHAYDADKLSGNTICAVDAKGGEEFKGLLEVNTKLEPEDVAIVDGSGVVGLGGVLGGAPSSVTDETTNIYLEAAWFDRARLARTGQRLDLQTDARYRNERGVDPAITAYAARRAALLMQEICGGEVSAQTTAGSNQKDLPVINFDPQIVKTFGGLDVSTTDVIKHLKSLQFKVEEGETLQVTPPSFRTTMENPEDLVEEVLRMEGFESVPTVLPELPEKLQQIDYTPINADRLSRRMLAANGFLEVMTYSFIGRKVAEKFANGQTLRNLSNPIDSENMGTMRPSLLPSLLQAASANLARSEQISRLAEVGKTFSTDGEVLRAAGILLPDERRHWQGAPAKSDLFAAKAQAIEILASMGLNAAKLQIRSEAKDIPSHFHPGRSGAIALGKNVFAYFGEIHPAILKDYDLPEPTAAFEVNLDATAHIKGKSSKFEFSQYQPVRRDLAFLVDESVAALDLLNTVRNANKDLGREAEVFDCYQGKGVPEGKKSLAISITLQSNDKTLEDKEITAAVNNAVQAAKKHYNAELRD